MKYSNFKTLYLLKLLTVYAGFYEDECVWVETLWSV